MLITLVVFGLSLVTGIFGWLVRELMTIKTDVALTAAEHRTNGGSTTRDAINRIERKLDAHINWHLDQ